MFFVVFEVVFLNNNIFRIIWELCYSLFIICIINWVLFVVCEINDCKFMIFFVIRNYNNKLFNLGFSVINSKLNNFN